LNLQKPAPPKSFAVSVLIPVFNGQDYIADALTSVTTQSFSDFEVIVVDDGSTDDTAAVIAEFGHPSVRYVRQDRAGAAAARNRAADLAAGRILAFLDADDLWLPAKLERQCAALDAEEGDMIFTRLTEFVSPDLPADEAARVKAHPQELEGIIPSTLVVSRSDFEKVGPFDRDIQVGEFIDWFGRAQEAGLRCHVVPEMLARRRIHRTNLGRGNHGQRQQYAQVLQRMLERRRAAGQAR
jgi:glycosyltransferase involved in cell wall biosynthesis